MAKASVCLHPKSFQKVFLSSPPIDFMNERDWHSLYVFGHEWSSSLLSTFQKNWRNYSMKSWDHDLLASCLGALLKNDMNAPTWWWDTYNRYLLLSINIDHRESQSLAVCLVLSILQGRSSRRVASIGIPTPLSFTGKKKYNRPVFCYYYLCKAGNVTLDLLAKTISLCSFDHFATHCFI